MRQTEEPSPLLQLLLEEQHQLTTVEQFSQTHERLLNGDSTLPRQSRYYSHLLPAAPPGPGQQYAFEVDRDRCSGCKAGVVASHSPNRLDEQETWRDVGLLTGGSPSAPVMQHVTTACHHCLEPACMLARSIPVKRMPSRALSIIWMTSASDVSSAHSPARGMYCGTTAAFWSLPP